MIKKSSVEKWKLPKILLYVKDDGDIVSITCKSCKEHYVDDDDDESEEELLKKFTGKNGSIGFEMDKRLA